MPTTNLELHVAILIPCYNEEQTIPEVICSFQKALPSAKVYVYNNNSTDNTVGAARQAGAIVRNILPKGKGNVVRQMFADIDADVYIMVDGDATYDATTANAMLEMLCTESLDMVVGVRIPVERKTDSQEIYRNGHKIGNLLFTKILSLLFHSSFTDVFSGYRVFSKRFVKSFPNESKGFDIETELTIHSMEMRLPSGELDTHYFSRPEGSHSKLSSYKDGIKILTRIFLLLKEVRPMLFFGSIACLCIIISLSLFLPIFIEYIHSGLVPRLPTAILSASFMLLGFMSFGCGLILDGVIRTKRILKRLAYLSYPATKNSELTK